MDKGRIEPCTSGTKVHIATTQGVQNGDTTAYRTFDYLHSMLHGAWTMDCAWSEGKKKSVHVHVHTCTVLSLHVLYMYSGSSTSDPTVLHVLPLMVHVPVHATTATTTTATCTCDIGGPAGFRSAACRRLKLNSDPEFFSSAVCLSNEIRFSFNCNAGPHTHLDQDIGWFDIGISGESS